MYSLEEVGIGNKGRKYSMIVGWESMSLNPIRNDCQ